ncbi:MAG: hypothetical protein IPL08_12510 [Saprospiraceae bacterium]|nr:hypothetical protein [Saprospiraceae bacterium]MBK8671359.1 hypothetical protein [Saprospiraceae bacterium]MBL0099406.1 hypothetical protein [Saprospiraceae bacterium]
MGRWITWVVLGLFIVIVPFGSWYYLKKGLDYRKKSLSELVAKDSIATNLDSLHILRGFTSLIVTDTQPSTTKVVGSILEQFKNIKGFQIFYMDSLKGTRIMPAGYMADSFDKYTQQSFILMDTAMHIRNVYRNDTESVRKMIEHIAMVIPRPKESDIKMKK